MTPPSRRPGYMCRYNKVYRAGYRASCDPTPAMRKLQALHAMGHPRQVLADMTGISYNYLFAISRGTVKRVKKQTAALIDAAYDELHMVRRDDTTGKRVSAHAVRQGYAPPMAWDSIETDETPRGMR